MVKRQEVIKLMASLSSLISNLDKLQSEEALCNKRLVQYMAEDPRATFSKAEAAMKSSDVFLSYKNILSLKQFALRGLSIVRLHLQYLLKTEVDDESEKAWSE